MANPKVSIIVPVYNVEQYLEHCLESLLNQTLQDIEIILINDGSTDASGDICERFQKTDSRIVLNHQANAGVSAARNAGLSRATGDCIGFVDPDDWVEPVMFERMYGLMEREKSDLCLCSYVMHKHGKTVSRDILVQFAQYIGQQETLQRELLLNLIASPDLGSGNTIMGSVCRMLVRRTLVGQHGLRFANDVLYGEDLLFCIGALLKSRNISLTTESLYHYVLRDGSATQTYRPRFLEERDRLREVIEHSLSIEGRLSDAFQHRLDIDYVNSRIFAMKNECKKENRKSMAGKMAFIRDVCSDRKLKRLVGETDIRHFAWRKKAVLGFIRKDRVALLWLYYTLLTRLEKFIFKFIL